MVKKVKIFRKKKVAQYPVRASYLTIHDLDARRKAVQRRQKTYRTLPPPIFELKRKHLDIRPHSYFIYSDPSSVCVVDFVKECTGLINLDHINLEEPENFMISIKPNEMKKIEFLRKLTYKPKCVAINAVAPKLCSFPAKTVEDILANCLSGVNMILCYGRRHYRAYRLP